MRKNFGKDNAVYPMPVFIVAAYDKDGNPNCMNAAWGGIYDTNQIMVCISEGHKTTKNILESKAFTVNIADAKHVVEADYVGVVSGNNEPEKMKKAGLTVTQILQKKYGAHHVSKLVYKLAFGSYNARTKNETEYDWLSVNKENVEKYLADELCGFPFTVSAMHDLITLTAECNTEKWAQAMPKSLPVYLVAGTEDPVGEYGAGVKKVCRMLHLAGVKNVKTKLYRGARHEILNEACFPTVCEDILAFTEKNL
jgi:hypothetical protein